MNRWALRVAAYATLMTDAYPPFRLEQGGHELPRMEPPPVPRHAPVRHGAASIVAILAGALLAFGAVGTAATGSLSAVPAHAHASDGTACTRHPGGEPATPPAAQPFWAATGSGSLTWTPEAGDWTVVVMNADASPMISTDVRLSATLPWLDALTVRSRSSAAGGRRQGRSASSAAAAGAFPVLRPRVR
ncbi:hypothetical protein [Nonomuraea salmonea]|jgi:hypothetical protein|uniref:Uncharacterized protein n=1 Tax=Nonomuraea salmonea TaxID=46181 RepID=A0ABV5P277_9ACTN